MMIRHNINTMTRCLLILIIIFLSGCDLKSYLPIAHDSITNNIESSTSLNDANMKDKILAAKVDWNYYNPIMNYCSPPTLTRGDFNQIQKNVQECNSAVTDLVGQSAALLKINITLKQDNLALKNQLSKLKEQDVKNSKINAQLQLIQNIGTKVIILALIILVGVIIIKRNSKSQRSYD